MEFEQFPVGGMGNISYLLISDGEAALIDPAWEPELFEREIRNRNLKLKLILLTHGHPDHVNSVTRLTEAFPETEVWLHEGDHFMASGCGRLLSPGDGESVSLGRTSITALTTPGHSPGSVCWLTDGLIFTGDTLFNMNCGRVDLPGSSPEEMYNSLKKLSALPPETAVLPGHSYNGPAGTLGLQLRSNEYLRMAAEGKKALFLYGGSRQE